MQQIPSYSQQHVSPKQSHAKDSCLKGTLQSLKSQDAYGQDYVIGLDGENYVAQSLFGSFCSLFVFITTFLYAVQKTDVLIAKKDVDILSATKDLAFDATDIFNYENGFNIAVAFTEYNNNQEWELPPEYGSLKINSYSWGANPDGTFFTRRAELPTHVCSKE